jgi:hypothetical protein
MIWTAEAVKARMSWSRPRPTDQTFCRLVEGTRVTETISAGIHPATMHESVGLDAELHVVNSFATRANLRAGAGKVERTPFAHDATDAVDVVGDSHPRFESTGMACCTRAGHWYALLKLLLGGCARNQGVAFLFAREAVAVVNDLWRATRAFWTSKLANNWLTAFSLSLFPA